MKKKTRKRIKFYYLDSWDIPSGNKRSGEREWRRENWEKYDMGASFDFVKCPFCGMLFVRSHRYWHIKENHPEGIRKK